MTSENIENKNFFIDKEIENDFDKQVLEINNDIIFDMGYITTFVAGQEKIFNFMRTISFKNSSYESPRRNEKSSTFYPTKQKFSYSRGIPTKVHKYWLRDQPRRTMIKSNNLLVAVRRGTSPNSENYVGFTSKKNNENDIDNIFDLKKIKQPQNGAKYKEICFYENEDVKDFINNTIVQETEKDNGRFKIVHDKKSVKIRSYTGFDTEFTNSYEIIGQNYEEMSANIKYEMEILKDKQKLVSYQHSKNIAEDIFVNTIIISSKGQRMDLETFFDITESFYSNFFMKEYKKKNNQVIFDVTVVAHKNSVDLTKLDDIYYKKNIQKMFQIHNCLLTKKRGLPIKKVDNNRNYKTKGIVHFRDSLCLYPPTSLKKIGELVGLEKVEIEQDAKDNMDSFITEDFLQFYEYAKTDAEITVKFAYDFYGGGDLIMPTTIAGLAEQKFLEYLKMEKKWSVEEIEDFFGRYIDKTTSKKRSLFYETTIDQRNEMGRLYYGGRNETFYHGFLSGCLQDIDASSFYPIIASLLKRIDYSTNVLYFNVDKNKILTKEDFYFSEDNNFYTLQIGTAYVEFDFSEIEEDVIPCITQKTSENGLVFTKKGITKAHIGEIKSAVGIGAKVKMINGWVYQFKNEYVFRDFVMYYRNLRTEAQKKYGKGSPQEIMIKLIMNSFTGKMGQGLKDKKAYSINDNKTVNVPESKITNPAYVTSITSLGRTIITEIINLFNELKLGAVINVVTDGFLYNLKNGNLTDLELNSIIRQGIYQKEQKYPNLTLFLKELDLYDLPTVETKHKGEFVLSIKTRMTLVGSIENTDNKSHVSMTGYKLSFEEHNLSKNELIEELIRKFINRNGRIENNKIVIPSVRKNFEKGKETVNLVKTKINLNYDYKRKPVDTTKNYIQTPFSEETIYSFYTEPWENLHEFYTYKKIYENNKEIAIKNFDIEEKILYIAKFSDLGFKMGGKELSLEQCILSVLARLSKYEILFYKNDKIDNYTKFKNMLEELKLYSKEEKYCTNDYYRRNKGLNKLENDANEKVKKIVENEKEFQEIFYKTFGITNIYLK